MLNKLRKLLMTELPNQPLATNDHLQRGDTLRLPPGAIVAEQGLRHLPGRTVQPLMDEAYVVVRTGPRSQWYATWQPYRDAWELLRLEDEPDLAAVEEPLLRRLG
ncbi:MAG: hypothetical protein JOY51_09310 [Nevskia sp.]|nr:hypothetical protein [Nevskia sp.]